MVVGGSEEIFIARAHVALVVGVVEGVGGGGGGAGEYVGGGRPPAEEDVSVVPLVPQGGRGGGVGHDETVRGGGGGEVGGVGRGGEGATEEWMLESLVWLHPRLRVIVQHLEDEGLELSVVFGGVAWFSLADSRQAPSLHPQDVIQRPTAWTTVHVLWERKGGREEGRRGREGGREGGRERGGREEGGREGRWTTMFINHACVYLPTCTAAVVPCTPFVYSSHMLNGQ